MENKREGRGWGEGEGVREAYPYRLKQLNLFKSIPVIEVGLKKYVLLLSWNLENLEAIYIFIYT